MRGSHILVLVASLTAAGMGTAVVMRRTAAHQSVSAPSAASAPSDAPEALTSGEGVAIKFSDKPLPMPALSLHILNGAPLTAESWHGKVVIVNFWATWCHPCREEIPALIALQDRYRGQLQIVGLSIDTGPPASVKQFVEGAGVNYPIAIADDKLQEAFGGVSAVPSTFVVNPDGGIVQRHVGLADPRVLEHEVRVLAKLPTAATVQVVKDTGQVLLANAAYATEIPGLDLSHCTPAQKESVLKQLNTDKCTCGCGLTLAQCRINDPDCKTSLPIAQKILERAVR